jgi:hypothetical protein
MTEDAANRHNYLVENKLPTIICAVFHNPIPLGPRNCNRRNYLVENKPLTIICVPVSQPNTIRCTKL